MELTEDDFIFIYNLINAKKDSNHLKHVLKKLKYKYLGKSIL
jgi:hypothetical protein